MNNPYFYKEMYGLCIRKDKWYDICPLSCKIGGKKFKVFTYDNESIKTVLINPLKTNDWHFKCFDDAFETLFPLN